MPRISEFFGSSSRCTAMKAATPCRTSTPSTASTSRLSPWTDQSSSARSRHANVRLVRKWALAHQDELARNWDLARGGRPLESVEPLSEDSAMTAGRPKWIVRGVTVIGGHRLRLLFEDGTVGDVSFEGRVWDGVLTPLNDPAYFARVEIAHSSLYWPEDELDLAPEPLYEAANATAIAQPVAAAA